MNDTSRTTAVLLAAGAGTRLGLGPKALLKRRGTALVEHLAAVLHDGGCSRVVVVLGAQAERVRREASLDGCTVVVNPAWEEGMGTSLRAGLGAVPAGENALVALVDQPALAVEAVRAVLGAHRPGQVTAAAYPDPDGALRRGHPVLFDASLLARVAASASGDEGARRFLQTHAGLVALVDCGAWGDGRDVDTPEDLRLLEPDPGS
ncbi:MULTISPECIES: nucleotidyltransferase family protein [Arthrobacter]|uniref:Nucleotidyltransferase family protein n=2 Tax=Arthrobacter TaxID=1663 RepID=A0ABU9KL48_9MICC|nr:nucleotidyltransferase family protein [Arthrobacter sp. YJM1]MDP5227629.1 nucleotidyltransferase family protein [Arthrobacter sp. YJM1]